MDFHKLAFPKLAHMLSNPFEVSTLHLQRLLSPVSHGELSKVNRSKNYYDRDDLFQYSTHTLPGHYSLVAE